LTVVYIFSMDSISLTYGGDLLGDIFSLVKALTVPCEIHLMNNDHFIFSILKFTVSASSPRLGA